MPFYEVEVYFPLHLAHLLGSVWSLSVRYGLSIISTSKEDIYRGESLEGILIYLKDFFKGQKNEVSVIAAIGSFFDPSSRPVISPPPPIVMPRQLSFSFRRTHFER
jgi:hypothetical protein